MGNTGTLLIGYDVEKTSECAAFLTKAREVHREYNAPFTVFALGACIAAEPAAFTQSAADPLVDIAQHTWSHVLLKTVVIDDGEKVEMVRGAPLEQIEDEVRRTAQIIEQVCDVTCAGLTGPWAYYRGLMDRPDILDILHDLGIRYLRTYGRDANDFQPVSLDIQPFWYNTQGFPDMLECMIHGWQDVYLRSRLGWEHTEAFAQAVAADMDAASSRGLVLSWGSHDWSSLRADPDLTIIRRLLSHARAIGMEIVSYRDYWERRRLEQQSAPAAIASAGSA